MAVGLSIAATPAMAAGLFGITSGMPLAQFDRAKLRSGTLYDIVAVPQRMDDLYAYAVQVNDQNRVCMAQAQTAPIRIGKDGADLRTRVSELIPIFARRFGEPALGSGVMVDRNSAWLESFVDRLKSGKNALGAEWAISRGHHMSDNLSEVLIFATPKNSRQAIIVVQGWFGDERC